MYTKIMDNIKTHLDTAVNAVPVQVLYFGDALQLDLRKAAILLEPRTQDGSAKTTRWNDGIFSVRLHIVVGMVRDYMASMRELETLIGAEDTESQVFGVKAALAKLKADPIFSALNGKMGGKIWRIRSGVLDTGRTTFGINQIGSEKVNVAQIEMNVYVEIER